MISGKYPILPCLLCWVTAGVVSITGPVVFEYDDEYKDCYIDLDETEYKVFFVNYKACIRTCTNAIYIHLRL